MLLIIQEKIVNKKQWATDEEIIDYYAIGQSTPGIIAVNTATFIGYNRKGILGAIFATLGLVAPSLVIITTIAKFFTHFQDYKMVQHAFAGVEVAVIALIDRKSTRLNSSHVSISYAVFCLKKNKLYSSSSRAR